MIVMAEEVKHEILSLFISKVEEEHNCASILINKDMLPFTPRSGYNMTDYVDEKLLSIAREKGFEYNKHESDDHHLVFIKK